MSKINKDLNQSRKSSNFGVLEMDQNRVKKGKFLGYVVFLFWP